MERELRVEPMYSEKPAPGTLCPPQIPHDMTCDGTQATEMGSWRLTAKAMARPKTVSLEIFLCWICQHPPTYNTDC
jgi:hypothetical protein